MRHAGEDNTHIPDLQTASSDFVLPVVSKLWIPGEGLDLLEMSALLPAELVVRIVDVIKEEMVAYTIHEGGMVSQGVANYNVYL